MSESAIQSSPCYSTEKTKTCIYFIGNLLFWLIVSLPTNVLAEQLSILTTLDHTFNKKSIELAANPSESQILLLGLIINDQVVVESIRVRGKEDGEKAVDFDRWLVPLEDLKKPLKLEIFNLPGGGIEIAAPTIKGRYRLTNFSIDNQLGIVISIADLRAIVGNPVTFDIYKYALVVKLPDEERRRRPNIVEPPPLTDGLPGSPPQRITISAIEQKVNVSGGEGRGTNTNGELRAIGNLYDTSWYVRAEQPNLDQPQTWNIAEASIIRQQPKNDLIVGSQTPFWQRRGGSSGTYWGLTHIGRNGFVPPTQTYGNDFLVTDRLQSRRVGRSISGQAAPGTIVRLVRGAGVDPLDEVLVDSSGIFRFDNVVVAGSDQEFFGQDYRLLIYPKGEFTTNPEVRFPQFTTTPGQLPKGATAWVVTGGGNLVRRGTFGDFTEYQGGALYRQGLTESLTIGVGAAYDQGFLGVGEIFWQPNNVPLEVALFTAVGTKTDFVGRLTYRPSPDFYFNANTDNTSSRADARWRLTPGFSAIGNYDTLRGISIGGEYINNSQNSGTFARATIDDQLRTKIFVSQRLDRWQASFQSNESNLFGQVSYQLTDAPNSDTGHRLTAGYQVSQQNVVANTSGSNSLTSITWQYRSPNRVSDGSYAWQSELSYNWTNFGSGVFAGVNVSLLPGLRLNGSYRGVSESVNQSEFSLSLSTTLLIDGGVRGTDTRLEDLRRFGRIQVSAFFDNNQNGVRDPGEQEYWDPLLIKINQSSANLFQTKTEGNVGTISLPPASYRVEVDPAGYPPNFKSDFQPLRVDVVASDTTRISIPLTPSYVVSGILKDQNGNPVADTRVEIISADNKVVADSVTNNAGLFYLEGLSQGTYQIKTGAFPVSPTSIKINADTKPLQEVNLTIQLPEQSSQKQSQKDTISINPILIENIHNLNKKEVNRDDIGDLIIPNSQSQQKNNLSVTISEAKNPTYSFHNSNLDPANPPPFPKQALTVGVTSNGQQN
jgi:Carboxypeptidase regulatory-like domain